MARKPILSQHDVHQPVWQSIKAYYEARLATLRARLENPNNPEADRAGLIYRIDEIKQLLAIGEEQKNVAGAGE